MQSEDAETVRIDHPEAIIAPMQMGTSTGSLVTPLIAMNEMALLEHIYTTVTTAQIVEPGRIGDRINDVSIFDAAPLWNLIQTNYTDASYQNLLASGRKVFINTTCLQSGQLVVFTNDQAPANPRRARGSNSVQSAPTSSAVRR